MTGIEALTIIRELGLSQQEAAEAIGFRPETVSRYIRGRLPIPAVVELALVGLRARMSVDRAETRSQFAVLPPGYRP